MSIKFFVFFFSVFIFWKILDSSNHLHSKEVIERKALPMDISYETIEAESYLNQVRTSMRMQSLSHNINLESAAKAHANYLVTNNEFSHDEINGHDNFIAVKPVERALKFGYLSKVVYENLSTNNHNARSSVDGLFSAIYHRFGFLSPSINEMGISIEQDKHDSDKSAFVYLFGNSNLNLFCSVKSFSGAGKYWKPCKDESHRVKDKDFMKAFNDTKKSNPRIILYPYNGQIEVPPAFYAEVPDPLPNHEVSGFPVSVEFNDYFFKKVGLISFTLYDEKGSVVDVHLMDRDNDPHHRFTTHQFSLFPLKRLEYNQSYRAELKYVIKGKHRKKSWQFRTKQIRDAFFVIRENNEVITLEAKKSYVLYFEPSNAHDLITNMQFPVEVDVQFLDNNTIKLTVMSDDLDSFELKSDRKNLRINVK